MNTYKKIIIVTLSGLPGLVFITANDLIQRLPYTPEEIIITCIEDDFGDCCDEPFTVWYDNDGDGLGNPDSSAVACLDYENWVINDDDPDDGCFSNIIDCNGTCDGTWVLDELGECCEETQTIWQDLDGDSWGNASVSIEACHLYSGWVNNYLDKNDSLYCQINVFDICGVCEGDGSTCTGCTDQTALNYEPENIIDDGSCIYASDHIWHVANTGSDESGTGTVENPFETIQHTIGVSQELDTILVHSGVYYENINFNGENLLLTSMFTFTGDTNYIYQTILDGGQMASVVTFENDENNTAILSGFTITHGSGNIGGNLNVGRGGGIFCDNADPTLKNLIITDNIGFFGGGIYCRYSNPLMTALNINGNTADGGGSAEGAGIFLVHSSPSISNTVVANNTSVQEDGGGIVMNAYSSPILQNVRILNNWAYSRGGGIFCWNHSNPVLDSVIIMGNTTMTHAGGVHLDNHCDPIFRNSIIADNTTLTDGGGIYIYDGSGPILINTTVVNNSAGGAGGGLFLLNSDPVVSVNSIIWDNTPEQIHLASYAALEMAYSDVMGGEAGFNHWAGDVNWGEGNLNSVPLFMDPDNGDFSLQTGSPCIDAGTDYYQVDGTVIVDLSADEYSGNAPDMGAVESIVPGLIGDLNHDATLNIFDIIILVNYIIYGGLPGGEFVLADLNQDGVINILDIILLINLILQDRLIPTVQPAFARLSLNDNLMRLQTDGPIAGGQLRVSGNFQIREVLLPESWEFYCESGIILFFSPSGASLQNDSILMYEGDMQVSDMLISDWTGRRIEGEIQDIPTGTTISAAYPNPFNPVTTIEYTIPDETDVEIAIFNLQGKEVETLVRNTQPGNHYSVSWNAVNYASGIYWARIRLGPTVETRKLILLK
ncbi:MAG: T9SS type A sorting domain-containing protein [FCB group bacterium]|nr:T9SS type A sorting domain-containing protein [FCB group bacterium]